jgi:hypothetical protein
MQCPECDETLDAQGVIEEVLAKGYCTDCGRLLSSDEIDKLKDLVPV